MMDRKDRERIIDHGKRVAKVATDLTTGLATKGELDAWIDRLKEVVAAADKTLAAKVESLIKNNGGLTDTVEGPDTYVLVRREDFESLSGQKEEGKNDEAVRLTG